MRIEAKGLCKQFSRFVKSDEKNKKQRREDFFAVDHLSLHASAGEILGVLGPNGAGKTTLLRMLGGIMKPDEGSVILSDDDGNVISDKNEIKKHIGYISGNTKLYNRFSIREMLMIFGDIYGIPREECEKRAQEIIDLLDMKKFADNRIGALSTGQTQRAGIARTLMHSPSVYIFDEPTLGLDILSSETIISFMKKERERGCTVLYSTHYMEEAEYLCDRINMIYNGNLIAEGSPAELKKNTKTDNLRDAFRACMKEAANE